MVPKMIRDRVLQEIVFSGRECEVHTCKSIEEYDQWAARKMVEELGEFLREPSAEEAADMYEVFFGLINKHNISLNEVRRVAAHKREELGGFRNGTILHKVLKPVEALPEGA